MSDPAGMPLTGGDEAVLRRLPLLEGALNQIRDAVYVLDERGRPHYVNEGACRMLGYPREALMNMGVGDVDRNWSGDMHCIEWGGLKAQGARSFETVHLRSDGQPIPVEVISSYVEHLGAGYVMVLVRDITERKRDELLLRQRELEFRTLVENSPDTVARYDRHGQRVYANPALVGTAGLPREALLGLRPGERLAVDPSEAQRYQECIRGVLDSGEDAVFDLSWRSVAGRLHVSQIRMVGERDLSGQVVSVLAIGRDISSPMEAQRQLRALLEAIPDIITRYDRLGRLVYVSAASRRRFGRAARGYLGKTSAEIEPEYGPPLLASVLEVVRTGLPRALEVPYPVDGELRHWEVRHVPEIGEDGRVIGVLAIARDITERLASDRKIQELHRHREVVAEQERRHIARELHDEMGQVLSALRMEMSLLRMRWGGGDAELHGRIEGLQGMVDHVIHVVRNLVSSLRPPVLDLGIAAALEWLVDEFGRSSGATCHLHVDHDAVALDEEQTTMVFRIAQESLTNVARHASANVVHVRLERCIADAVLSVADNGRGVDPAARSRQSLGHLVLQERADLLGGHLDIRSQPGSGTMVRVMFPLRAAAGSQ